jgi:hypothetical protein
MSTAGAATVSLAVLAAVGILPALALVGTRWIALTLAPLAGAVIAAIAATCFTAVGGTFMGWFAALSAVVAAGVVVFWKVQPGQRPRAVFGPPPAVHGRWHRIAGVVGAIGILATCAWSLRALSSPTVGFDARALWILRAGWFLHPHQQLLIELRLRRLALNQTAYPPLVSASGSVAWSVTGNHTDRLAVVVTALLNTCALATAAFAVVECGRRCYADVSGSSIGSDAGGERPSRGGGGLLPLLPLVGGVVAAWALVFIAFGVTEPFMTNGYADPLWSLAALGAVAYGLQLPDGRSNQGATALLILVAGLSKDEGFATALVLIGVVAFRRVMTMPGDQRRRSWWPPVLVGGLELGTVAAWPALMRVIHARGVTSTFSPPAAMFGRARATYDGFAPYLHVLLLAVPLAVVGGLALSRVRRASGIANDWWGWAGLASGLLAVGGALVTGSDDIQAWLVTTVHRVTEFPALTGWWIVATWTVVGSAAPAAVSLPPVAPRRRPQVEPPAAGGGDGGHDDTHATQSQFDPMERPGETGDVSSVAGAGG